MFILKVGDQGFYMPSDSGCLNPATALREDSLCLPVLLGLCQRQLSLWASVFLFLYFDITAPELLLAFLPSPLITILLCRVRLYLFKPHWWNEFKMFAICLLKTCGEMKRARITNASVTGFVLYVNDEKITWYIWDIIRMTWSSILTVLVLKRETYWL